MDSVFAGATSDMVQLRYTWVTGRDVTEIDGGDEFGALTVKSTAGKTIVLWNEDESIDLSQDSIENIAGDMNFAIADDDEYLRFYPFVERRTIGVEEGPPESEPLCGDLNSDGKVDMGDVILLLNHVGNPEAYPLDCGG